VGNSKCTSNTNLNEEHPQVDDRRFGRITTRVDVRVVVVLEEPGL
jgi:hypothetical protein